MGRYRKVDCRIWNDAKFRLLSDRGKLAFLFVLTHPHMTSLGAMRATLPGLAAELGWSAEAFQKAFGEAFRKGLVEHDETAHFVGLPNFLKYNSPESPNVVKSWSRSLDLIPECDAKYLMLQRVKAFVEGLSKAFGEAFRKAMPNQEHKPKYEHEPEQQEICAPDGSRARATPPPVEPNDDTETEPDGDAYTDEFDAWWALYPRKKGKRKAFASFRRAKARVGVGRLMEAVQAFAQAMDNADPQFVPYAEKWLNHGRYDDDPETLADSHTQQPQYGGSLDPADYHSEVRK